MTISIERTKCISCGACVIICPAHAITLSDGIAQIDPHSCNQCKICLCKCYTRAIRRDKPQSKPSSFP